MLRGKGLTSKKTHTSHSCYPPKMFHSCYPSSYCTDSLKCPFDSSECFKFPLLITKVKTHKHMCKG